jgi:carbonic anhydrase
MDAADRQVMVKVLCHFCQSPRRGFDGYSGFWSFSGRMRFDLKHALLTVLILMFCVSLSQEIVEAQQASEHASAAQLAGTAPEIWADLMEGNHRFVAGKAKARDLPALRVSVEKAQHPKAVVLTCSDSRVPPELVFDQSLGDLFVVRSAGNIADAIGVGSIEYAVEHLGSRVLVILGHTKCGAVTAACSGEKMLSSNLQAIVDKIQPAVSKTRSSGKNDELIETAIKENIHQSAKDVLGSSQLLHHLVDEGKLSIFEAEYQLETGEVILLAGSRQ